MRSNRSPYFLYKNHKDPQIRALVAQAEHMSWEEIQSLSCKPDLKKALFFVKKFGHQDRVIHTAELVADNMQKTIIPQKKIQGDLYEYLGPHTCVKIYTTNHDHYWEVNHDIFLHVEDRIWLNHTWCKPTDLIWSHSKKICSGDLNTYNQILHTHLNKKYHAS